MKTVAYFEVQYASPRLRERLTLDDDRGAFCLNIRSRGRFGYPATGARPEAGPTDDLEAAVRSFLDQYETRLGDIDRSATPRLSEIQVRDRRVRQAAGDHLKSLALRRETASQAGWGRLVERVFSSLQPDEATQRLLAQVYTQRTLAAIRDFRDRLQPLKQAVDQAHPPDGTAFRHAHQRLVVLVEAALLTANGLHRHLELNLATPDRGLKHREVNQLARQMIRAEQDLEKRQEQQQWETVKFADAMARVLSGSPQMSRALGLSAPVQQALLGLSAGE